MTQYVARPNARTDSAILWHWLERNHPELLEEFKLAFNQSVVIAVRAREEAAYPELVEYLLKALLPVPKET